MIDFKKHTLSGMLLGIWQQQRDYNLQIKALQTEKQNWSEVYLLGLVDTVHEVLRQIGWKRNRAGAQKEPVRENVAGELASLTKYVFCLWQEYGFTPQDMLEHVSRKGDELQYKLQHEFFPQKGGRYIITDLDGTGADYRAGFQKWWGHTDDVRSLNVDLDNDVPYLEYEKTKTRFEASGGYSQLPIYEDWGRLIRQEQRDGTHVVVITARPAQALHRIWEDTMVWLQRHGIAPDSLAFGSDERITELLRFGALDNDVVLLEDNPALALRAANSGIHVMMRLQPYNLHVRHPNIVPFETYPMSIPWDTMFPPDEQALMAQKVRAAELQALANISLDTIRRLPYGLGDNQLGVPDYKVMGTQTGRIDGEEKKDATDK